MIHAAGHEAGDGDVGAEEAVLHRIDRHLRPGDGMARQQPGEEGHEGRQKILVVVTP